MVNESHGRPGLSRLVGAGLAGMAAVLALAGCAAGQQAQTVGQKPAIDGVAADVGQLGLRNAGIAAPSTGSSYAAGGTALLQFVLVNNGATADRLVSVTSPIASSAVVSNAGLPDSGTAVSSIAPNASPTDSTSPSAGQGSTSTSDSASAGTNSASTSESPTASGIVTGSPIPAPSSVPIALAAGQSVQVGYSASGPNVELTGLTQTLFPAQTVPVTFTFANGATMTVDMSVRLSTDEPPAPTISAATSPAE